MMKPILRVTIAASMVLMLLSFTGVVVAEDDPSYYEEERNPDNETWMEDREDATLDNVVHMATRIGSFVIGEGTGGFGAILSSIFVGAIVVSMLGVSQVGLVGGGVVGTVTLGAMAHAGYAPPWVWAVVVFCIGLILANILLRLLR